MEKQVYKKMKFIAIKYLDGLIFVENKRPKHGDTAYVQFYPMIGRLRSIVEAYDSNKHYPAITRNKVIAQSTNLNIINIPYVEFESEEDIEETAFAKAKEFCVSENLSEPIIGWGQSCYFEGYVQGRGHEKKYTEEDVKKAWRSGQNYGNNECDDNDPKSPDEFVLSLNKPVKSIELETYTHQVISGGLRSNDDFGGKGLQTHESEVPITYEKDGKTFLKIKKINHD